MSRVVLVTGVSRYLGGRLAARLTADASIERVLGIDVVAPRPEVASALGRTKFVRVDIRNPLLAKVIDDAAVDTVVHTNVLASPLDAGSRAAMKEVNIIGTMQLLAACQRAPSVRRVVLRSTTAVYGCSPGDPAVFTEDMEPGALPRSGYAKDAVDVEGYVRGFGRRRPDVAVTVLRFANIIGPAVDTPLTRYFALPAVPTVFGFDPRLQVCHEDDALEVLRRAAVDDHPGTFNVSGDGVLLLSQAIRRAGRIAVPVLPPAVTVVGGFLRQAGLFDFSPEQLRFLEHGGVVDPTALHKDFGYVPAYTTAGAFDHFVAERLVPVVPREVFVRLEAAVLAAAGRSPVGG